MKAVFLAAATVVVAAACSKHEDPPTFHVTLSGAVKDSFAGYATACGGERGEQTTFVVLRAGDQHLVVAVPMENPVPGTYPVGVSADSLSAVYAPDFENGAGTFVGTRGQVTFTVTDPDRLVGTASYDGVDVSTVAPVHVEADFDAVRGGRFLGDDCGFGADSARAAALDTLTLSLFNGIFRGMSGTPGRDSGLAGTAEFCLHPIGGAQALTVRMRDTTGAQAFFATKVLAAGHQPVPGVATVWLEGRDGGGKRWPNGGYVSIEHFAADSVSGRVLAEHHPEPPPGDTTSWRYYAAFDASLAECTRERLTRGAHGAR